VRAWDGLVEDGRIYGAGVVAGAPGGDELGRRRVDQVVDALAVVTPRGDEYQTQILDPADVPVDPRGADGVLLVGFAPTQERLTSVAYRGVAMGAPWDKYVSAVIEQNYKAAIEAVFDEENDLGTIRFPEGSAAPVDDAEREAVVQRYWEIDGIVTGVARAIAWSVKGDEEAGAPDLRSARTKVVVEHIGNAPPELIEVDEETMKPARDRGVEEPLLVVFLPGVIS
jgi:hypothetical protein